MNVKLEMLSHLKREVFLFVLPYRHVTLTQAFDRHLIERVVTLASFQWTIILLKMCPIVS